MKKALSILLLLCMAAAMMLAVSCGKTNDEPKQRTGVLAASDDILKDLYGLPNERRDEGVYKEDGCKYEYDKKGNLIKVTDDTEIQTLEYDEAGKLIRYERTENGEILGECDFTYDEKEKTISGKSKDATSVIYCDNNWRKTKIESRGANGTLLGLAEYDKNGNQTKTELYKSDGNRYVYLENKYDKDGKLVKEIFDYDLGGYKSKGYTVYEYDKNGNQIKSSSYGEDDKLEGYAVYENDENGNQTKASTYDADGKIIESYTYEYDKNGNKIKESRYDEEDKICWAYEYDEKGNKTKNLSYKDGKLSSAAEYDKKGNAIKLSSYDADGKLTGYDTREYDENGNITKSTDYNSEGSIEEYTVYEYDENGKNTKSTYYNADGSVRKYDVSEYDENGKKAKLTYYNAEGKLTGYMVYEYDEDGNYKGAKYHGAWEISEN